MPALSDPAPATPVLDFLRLGWSREVSSLTFLVTITDIATLTAALTSPHIDRPDLAAALTTVWGQTSRVELGREASLVMYADIPFWEHQKHHPTPNHHPRLSTDERRTIAEAILDVGRACGADSLTTQQFTPGGAHIPDVRNGPGDDPCRVRL